MNMFENTPSDKVQLVGLGELPNPATCIVCGSGNYEGGYVDFRTFIDYHGSLLICGICLIQASELIGCITPEEALAAHEISTQVADENARLKEELEVARGIVASVESLRTVLDSVASGTAPDPDSSAAEQGEPVSPESAVSNGGEPPAKSDEPVKVRKRGDSNGSKSGNASKRSSSIQL